MTLPSTARLLTVLGLLLVASGCGGSSPTAPDQSSVAYAQTDFTVGTGAEATAGKSATVQYAGWLYSETGQDKKGAQFDAGTFTFVLGSNQVIKGFDTGVTGMKVGGTRRVIIPPSLGYGSAGSGQIPPNAALVFDLVLTSVQ
jgi:FKBP-type peptidyl-prolyl cis-trans isomerase FkpA